MANGKYHQKNGSTKLISTLYATSFQNNKTVI